MIGGGHSSFIGIVHRIASYIGEEYKLVGGAFDTNHDRALDFAKGYNVITLDVNDLNASGVLYYMLETENHVATKKMVVLK